MEKTTSDPPPSITEVYHPLALSPNADAPEVTLSPQKAVTKELPVGKNKRRAHVSQEWSFHSFVNQFY